MKFAQHNKREDEGEQQVVMGMNSNSNDIINGCFFDFLALSKWAKPCSRMSESEGNKLKLLIGVLENYIFKMFQRSTTNRKNHNNI